MTVLTEHSPAVRAVALVLRTRPRPFAWTARVTDVGATGEAAAWWALRAADFQGDDASVAEHTRAAAAAVRAYEAELDDLNNVRAAVTR